ncbi:sulfate/molybdate ABC transporter ATP-binding protein [Gloeocapsa sp. PCC 73106]|uniref:sulfate/molybdate ABC transporter ATP-binding protein n=1 Tax=Gloeocapsa sp. PCC 73106 TaxID=102232 RepID=UPI0002ABA48F|nr:TOBE-like domain-containing protein [Gloeocapsa sp. PCC 73106]ELR99166.1 sulfate ABC transporter, ATP-binding protein [Gloeocapsa sp. PCC 73106]
MSIFVHNVSKKFGNFQALSEINLQVEERKLVAILGPSGSGKSTLLRMIAGLEIPDQGKIMINGRDATHLDIRQRNIGFVFQHYALFKHLTVRQNIAFGLEIRKHPRTAIKPKVDELLELIQLEGYGNRYPAQLSGGQRQRVALARALIVQPQVLLLDEPFGALDAKVRKELRAWLRRLHDEVHITSVFVTHDQEEAMEVADQIIIMNHGRIEQIGSPAEIYDNPVSPFVMQFVGEVNILPSHAHLFETQSFSLPEAEVFVRPHELEISLFNDGCNSQAKVKRILHLGREVQAELVLPDNLEITVHLTKERAKMLNLKIGQLVYVKPRSTKHFSTCVLSNV